MYVQCNVKFRDCPKQRAFEQQVQCVNVLESFNLRNSLSLAYITE